MHNKKKFLSKKNNGSVLIQVIISAAIIIIVVAGLISLLKQYQLRQQQIALQTVLSSLQSKFTKIIQDNNSWRFTFESPLNPNMTCIANRTPCSPALIASTYSTSLDRIVLKSGPGGSLNDIFYDGRPTSTQGFTLQGQPCTTFTYNMSAGDTNCPIGYIVNWRALGSTADPQVVVTAKLIFNPADSHPFKNFFNKTTSSTTISNYDVVVYK